MKNKKIDIILSPNCNLDCKYCFQGNFYHKNSQICASTEIIDNFINFCERNRITYIDIFGGEPLYHKKQFTYLTNSFLKNNGTSMGFTTNGTLIDNEIINIIKNPDVNVLLSLDGKKESHDSMRGGFNKISQWFPILTKKEKITIAMQAGIIKGLYENLEYIWDIGFRESVFINVIHNYGWYDSSDIRYFEKEYERAIKGMLSGKGNLLCAIQMYFLLQNAKITPSCGITNESMSCDWKGNLYPCMRASELGEEFSIGDIFNGLDTKRNEIIRKRILDEELKSKSVLKYPFVNFCPVSTYLEHKCFDGNWSDDYCKLIEIKEKLVSKYYYEIQKYLKFSHYMI